MAKTKPRLCIIEWEDSTSFRGWGDTAFVKGPPIACKSVGWVLQRDKRKLVMAGTSGNNGDWNQRHTIPMGCIKKICRLRRTL